MPSVGSHYAPYHATQHGRRRIAQQIQATPRSPKMVPREKPITPLTTAAQRSRKAPPRETPSNAATMPLVSRRIIPIRRETWPGPLAHAARAATMRSASSTATVFCQRLYTSARPSTSLQGEVSGASASRRPRSRSGRSSPPARQRAGCTPCASLPHRKHSSTEARVAACDRRPHRPARGYIRPRTR